MLDHIRGGVVLYSISKSSLKASRLHTQQNDDGQHYFTVGFRLNFNMTYRRPDMKEVNDCMPLKART